MTKIIEGARDGGLAEIQLDQQRFWGDRQLQRRTEFPSAYDPDIGPLREADRT